MIEGIREIGGKKLGGSPLKLSDLTLNLDDEIKGRKQHLLILNYKLFDKTIDIDSKEINDNTPKKYLWVGNAEASNSPQIYFTTNNLSYLLSQTIPNLIQIVSGNSESQLGKLLQLSLNEIFIDFGRNNYLLNWEKIKILGKKIDIFDNKGLKEEYDEYRKVCEQNNQDKTNKKERNKRGQDLFKKILEKIESKVLEFIKSEKQLTKKEINLYTLKINGKLMVEDEEYQRIVLRERIDSRFEPENRKVCSCCNEIKPVTGRPGFAKSGSVLGCYITDKVGFSSGLSGDFLKNFVLCKDCYEKFLAGKTFIENNFRSSIGGLKLYIIPKFLFPIGPSINRLTDWSRYIIATFNSAKSLEGLREFEKKIEDYRRFESNENNYILNLLFWERGTGAETKVLKLIKDVPPTRIKTLTKTANEIKNIGDRVLGISYEWAIDLQSIYYLIPLRKTQNKIEYRKLLSFYDAIFSGKSISYNFLINQFIELARVYRFKQFDTHNIGTPKNPDRGFVYAILKTNLLFLYLQRLDLLKVGGESMNYDSLQVDKGIKDFLKEMGYDESRVAMFLLGYLIGKIGNEQYWSSESHTKPILNKITFEGMNPNKLIRLTNEIFEKLKQYKLFSNEREFSECKILLDKSINNWPLSDQENVFYVLSGYAYATHQAIESFQKKQGETKEEEVKENG